MNSAISIIGFGEVGQVLGEDLPGDDIRVYDILLRDPNSKPSLAICQSRCTATISADDAVSNASTVISAVTVDEAVAAAQSVLRSISPGTWYVDLNSGSPENRRRQAALIEARGGRYVEVAVMAPIAPKRLSTSVLLGGPHAGAFEPVAHSLGFRSTQVYSDQLGQCSAAKLCRSVLVKGMESLVMESLLAAQRLGVLETVLESLDGYLGCNDWNKVAPYLLTRTLTHGKRRAAEMREAAATVAQSGQPACMSNACANKQDWSASLAQTVDFSSLSAILSTIPQQERE